MLKKTTTKMDAKDYQVIAAQVLKILKKDKKEQGIWDVSAAANKRDIMELQSTIAESKNSLEKIITKNKNDTDIKLKDIEKEIVSIKSNLEKKIVESKNVLLQWILGMITGYTILLIVVLRFFEK